MLTSSRKQVVLAQMKKLIGKRNDHFKAAVNAFLIKCVKDGVDPVEALNTQATAVMPAPHNAPRPTPSELPVGQVEVNPDERPDIATVIEEIRKSGIYKDQIVEGGLRTTPAHETEFGSLDFRLSQGLVNALYHTRGITQFYAHQAEAINALHRGEHVIVTTSTSSGKSLIYQLPVIHALEQNRETRAMFIFPTKALAQDQKRSLQNILGHMRSELGDVLVETFDGDTPMENRQLIRQEANIIFTNPDMLHLAILPNESAWRPFLRSLRYLVLDELHTYTSQFGLHLSMILLRLQRILHSLGNTSVRFVSCSATISNATQHMSSLFSIPETVITHISTDGSPSGPKTYVLWNPPLRDSDDPSQGRIPLIPEAAKVFVELIKRGIRTIAFTKIRKHCELLLQATHDILRSSSPSLLTKVTAYRGGYTPQDRRKIEKDMFTGQILGIVATNALELGVDIGSLDAVINVGFPFTVANWRQQSGRAGRRNRDSLCVLVGDEFSMDQTFMKNPDSLFEREPGDVHIAEDEEVRVGHLQCAADEMAIDVKRDKAFFGPELAELAARYLRKDPSTGYFLPNERFLPHPAGFIDIRGPKEEDHVAVMDVTNGRNEILEMLEPSRAIFTVYEGGVFMHMGWSYIVKNVDLDAARAEVELVRVGWYTEPRDFTDVDPVETELTRPVQAQQAETVDLRPDPPEEEVIDLTKEKREEVVAHYGTISITTTLFSFFRLNRANNAIIDATDISAPPWHCSSKGFWIDVPVHALQILERKKINIAAAIHGAQHCLISCMGSGRSEGKEQDTKARALGGGGGIRTECKAPQKELYKRPSENSRKRPARLIFYDSALLSFSKKTMVERVLDGTAFTNNEQGGKKGAFGNWYRQLSTLRTGPTYSAFEELPRLVKQAVGKVEGCGCEEVGGCEECGVAWGRCKERNMVLSKAGALVVLKAVGGLEIEVGKVPEGPEKGFEQVGAGGSVVAVGGVRRRW
ncbi:P-loop containing nucleoside triphosphate hydrolase protein [Ascobolus immersus RN42]|uniref:P-loop containing nucleoside triphosphate hydrolase protein n=1 Tax=Ascobolus immersus RN42 TaxID=1160509 RepID=A0A3N4I1U8_ASCIM|nr:P-loop containing nucleoside triphosphate hydrolase protein [Ascobolus immersus RN42]